MRLLTEEGKETPLCVGKAEQPQVSRVLVLRMLIARVLTFVMDKEKKGGRRGEGVNKKEEKKKKRSGPG